MPLAARNDAAQTRQAYLATVSVLLALSSILASGSPASVAVAGKPQESTPFNHDLDSSSRHPFLPSSDAAYKHSFPVRPVMTSLPRVVHERTARTLLRRQLNGQSGESASHSHGKKSHPVGVGFAATTTNSGGNHQKRKGWARNRFKGMMTATERRPVSDKLSKGWATQLKAKQGKAEGRKAAEASQFENDQADRMRWDENGMERQVERRQVIAEDESQGVVKRVGPIVYKGGGVMLKPINVHLIFYGNWPFPKEMDIIKAAVLSLGDGRYDFYGNTLHKWWKVTVRYTDKKGHHAGSDVRLGKVVTDYYSLGNVLPSNYMQQIANIVGLQLLYGSLPLDPDALYVVLSSSDVYVADSPSDGLCRSFCGMHFWANYHGTNTPTAVKIAFVGDPTTQCPGGCGHNLMLKNYSDGTAPSPNGMFGPDAMVSTLLHEMSEAVTDPYPSNGWVTQEGFENADLCYNDFSQGLVIDKENGFGYNVLADFGLRFLIQSNWDPVLQRCRMYA